MNNCTHIVSLLVSVFYAHNDILCIVTKIFSEDVEPANI